MIKPTDPGVVSITIVAMMVAGGIILHERRNGRTLAAHAVHALYRFARAACALAHAADQALTEYRRLKASMVIELDCEKEAPL
jgi:hypothetical protein